MIFSMLEEVGISFACFPVVLLTGPDAAMLHSKCLPVFPLDFGHLVFLAVHR